MECRLRSSRHLLHSGVIGVLTGLTRTLSRWSYIANDYYSSLGKRGAWLCVNYLFTALRVEKNPAELDHFCRIFCHVHPMLITGRSDVDNHVAVEVGLLHRMIRHCQLSLYVRFLEPRSCSQLLFIQRRQN